MSRIALLLFFCYDLWHSWHLGMAKTFLGSTLALISDTMPGGNIDERFSNLTSIFLEWADERKIATYISTISKESIQWMDRKSFPNGTWSKGHVSTTLVKFVRWHLERENLNDNLLLQKCLEAATAIDEAMHALYVNDVWLEKQVAVEIGKMGLQHMKLYMEMATLCFQQRMPQFIFMPKSHICNHIFWELATCATPYIISPLAHAVQVDEDMVGRCSRLSRRVSPRQVVLRVLQRGLRASYAHFVKCGYINSL